MFLAFLTALYSHKFSNSKFEGDTPQAERFVRFEKDSVMPTNQIFIKAFVT
jgi:hypothetical protein